MTAPSGTRSDTTPSARSYLLTLFGEFVYPSTGSIRTSALIASMDAVGIAEKAARQALMRASAAGWIESRRDGREALWNLGATGLRVIGDGSSRVRALRQGALGWPGTWLVLHLTLPEDRRADRLRLYRSLQWLGFGSPTPGLWICPHEERAALVEARIAELGLAADTLAFAARTLPFGIGRRDLVQRAWDLPALAAQYVELRLRFEAMRPRSEEASFVAHVHLVNAIQRLPRIDPGLPAELLPPNWEGARTTKKLDELRARWHDAAHRHWQRLQQPG